MKKISGKRSKTDADFEELARLEFQGSLYWSDEGPVIPSYVLEACLVSSAKKSRDGKIAKSGLFVEKNAKLEYEGPRTREELWADENFRIVCPMVVQRARIMRTRPIFDSWSLTTTINYDDGQVNEAQVLKWIEDAGSQIGIGDSRPRYGRFEVEKI